MDTTPIVLALSLLVLGLSACGSPIALGEAHANEAIPSKSQQSPVTACLTTQPQEPKFTPPDPYPPTAPYGEFWYGTRELWTAMSPEGKWVALPRDENGYSQKVFWWNADYDMANEPNPDVVVSGRRLDHEGAGFSITGGTNGYHPDMGHFMLTGIEIPTAGCWEITGQYGQTALSFVVWIAP